MGDVSISTSRSRDGVEREMTERERGWRVAHSCLPSFSSALSTADLVSGLDCSSYDCGEQRILETQSEVLYVLYNNCSNHKNFMKKMFANMFGWCAYGLRLLKHL